MVNFFKFRIAIWYKHLKLEFHPFDDMILIHLIQFHKIAAPAPDPNDQVPVVFGMFLGKSWCEAQDSDDLAWAATGERWRGQIAEIPYTNTATSSAASASAAASASSSSFLLFVIILFFLLIFFVQKRKMV